VHYNQPGAKSPTLPVIRQFSLAGSCSLKSSNDGQLLIAIRHNQITIWNTDTWKESVLANNKWGEIRTVALSPDNKQLAIAFRDGRIILWDLPTNALVAEIQAGHHFGAVSLAYSPQGNQLVSGGADGTVKVWRLADTQLAFTWTGDGVDVAYSSDGRFILIVDWDRITIRDRVTGNVLRQLTGHDNRINTFVVSIRTSLVATGGKDRTVRVWDLQDKGTELVYHLPREASCLAVSMHGSVLAVGSGYHAKLGTSNGAIRFLDIPSGELLAIVPTSDEALSCTFLNNRSLFAVADFLGHVIIIDASKLP
jgi:WD40 repeat protein